MTLTCSVTTAAGEPPGRPARVRVELRHEDGASGVSFTHPSAASRVDTLAREVLATADPRGVTSLFDQLLLAESALGGGSHASAALDVALWNLLAQRRSEPLWKCLGGSEPRAQAYVTVPSECSTDPVLDRWCKRIGLESGIRGVKLEATADAQSDQRRLARIAAAMPAGDRPVALMLDFGGRFTAKECERRIACIERELELAFVEAPALAGDFLGCHRVGRAVKASVCSPPGMDAGSGWLGYFDAHAVDVVQLDLETMGLSGALRIADAAYAFELPVTVAYYPGNLGVHLSGALPYFMNVEVDGLRPGMSAQGMVRA